MYVCVTGYERASGTFVVCGANRSQQTKGRVQLFRGKAIQYNSSTRQISISRWEIMMSLHLPEANTPLTPPKSASEEFYRVRLRTLLSVE